MINTLIEQFYYSTAHISFESLVARLPESEQSLFTNYQNNQERIEILAIPCQCAIF